MNTAIVIPVRMQSTRLPGKPLALIDNIPMMIHVGNRAREANIGEIIFACAEQELIDIAKENGFLAVLTNPLIQNGSDRSYEALEIMDKQFDYIINLQGDLPFVNPSTIKAIYKSLVDKKSDIATAACVINSKSDMLSLNIVKVVISCTGYALYFTRAPEVPYGEGVYYKHIGIYGYSNASLRQYIHLPQSPLEKRESLEQLRAIENNMKISVAIVDDEPISVDTPQDLALARKKYCTPS